MTVVWRCSREGLDPGFASDVDILLASSPHSWYVLEGYRSLERSKALYEAYKAGRGPIAAPPGQSAHNYGLAVDVVLDTDPRPGLQPSWVTSLAGWLWLRATVVKHPRLSTGSMWPRKKDWPHIERYRWRRFIPKQGV